jgi:hypothetical protein
MSATENNQVKESFSAGADLTAHQYHVVRLSAADTVSQANSAGQTTQLGILQNNPESGLAATVALLGMSRVVAGSSMAVGDMFTTSASGRAVTVSSGGYVVGRVLEASTTDGDIVTCWIERPWKFAG